MAQYIRKLQQGGDIPKFKTDQGEYNLYEVLSGLDDQMQRQLRSSQMKKKDYNHLMERYQHIINGMNDGSVRLNASGQLVGNVSDNDKADSFIARVVKQSVNLLKKVESEEPKAKELFNPAKSFKTFFDETEFSGAPGKYESLYSMDTARSNGEKDNITPRLHRISTALQNWSNSLKEDDYDYSKVGGLEAYKQKINEAANALNNVQGTITDESYNNYLSLWDRLGLNNQRGIISYQKSPENVNPDHKTSEQLESERIEKAKEAFSTTFFQTYPGATNAQMEAAWEKRLFDQAKLLNNLATQGQQIDEQSPIIEEPRTTVQQPDVDPLTRKYIQSPLDESFLTQLSSTPYLVIDRTKLNELISNFYDVLPSVDLDTLLKRQYSVEDYGNKNEAIELSRFPYAKPSLFFSSFGALLNNHLQHSIQLMESPNKYKNQFINDYLKIHPNAESPEVESEWQKYKNIDQLIKINNDLFALGSSYDKGTNTILIYNKRNRKLYRRELSPYDDLTKDIYYAMRPAIESNKQGGLIAYIKSLKSFHTEKIGKASKLAKGGIVKADGGDLLLSEEENELMTKVPEWYRKLYSQHYLTDWGKSLGTEDWKQANNKRHHQTGTLWGAYDSNNAYISNPSLVGQDLNTYYNNNFSGKTLQEFIDSYNGNADLIRNRFNDSHKYNDRGWKDHNVLHSQMFQSRNGEGIESYDLGYDKGTEDILGSTSFMRRMDRYEKEFDQLTNEEKKARIHEIKDVNGNSLGWVYKTANGNIATLSTELRNSILGINSSTSQGEDPSTSSTVTDQQTEQEQQKSTSKESVNTENEIKANVESETTFPLFDYNRGETRWNKFWAAINNSGLANALSIGRLAMNLRNNRRVLNEMLKMRPALKSPIEQHKNVYTLFDVEQEANRQANQLRSQSGKSRTSDASINNATMLEGERNAVNAVVQANLQSNENVRKTGEQQWAVDNERMKYNVGVKDFNLAALREMANKAHEWRAGYRSSNQQNWNTFLMEQEQRARERQAENKNRQQTLDEEYLQYELSKGLQNDPIYQNLVARFQANPSDENRRSLAYYRQSYLNDLNDQYIDTRYQLYGLRKPNITFNRKGSKIDDTNVKKQQKDHDRLVKQVLYSISHHQKALDNLSKGQLLSIKKMLS